MAVNALVIELMLYMVLGSGAFFDSISRYPKFARWITSPPCRTPRDTPGEAETLHISVMIDSSFSNRSVVAFCSGDLYLHETRANYLLRPRIQRASLHDCVGSKAATELDPCDLAVMPRAPFELSRRPVWLCLQSANASYCYHFRTTIRSPIY